MQPETCSNRATREEPRKILKKKKKRDHRDWQFQVLQNFYLADETRIFYKSVAESRLGNVQELARSASNMQ